MEKRRIIKRGKLTYYISDSVIVDVGGQQWISYNFYNTPNRSNLTEFKKRIIASKPDQYGTVIELLDFARKYNLVGSGTAKPNWGLE